MSYMVNSEMLLGPVSDVIWSSHSPRCYLVKSNILLSSVIDVIWFSQSYLVKSELLSSVIDVIWFSQTYLVKSELLSGSVRDIFRFSQRSMKQYFNDHKWS